MYPGSYRSSAPGVGAGAVTAPALALALMTVLAVTLGGCAGGDYDSHAWFSKPVNMFGNNLGYSYSQLGQPTQQQRPITADDLVDASGACPGRPPAASAIAGAPPSSPQAVPQLNGAIGIGMSECDVVSRIGAPNAVNLGRTPAGDRLAVLTFDGGPRPGVYRFVGGRLKEMYAVQLPPPPPEVATKKSTKGKPTKRSSKKNTKKKRRPKQDHNG